MWLRLSLVALATGHVPGSNLIQHPPFLSRDHSLLLHVRYILFDLHVCARVVSLFVPLLVHSCAAMPKERRRYASKSQIWSSNWRSRCSSTTCSFLLGNAHVWRSFYKRSGSAVCSMDGRVRRRCGRQSCYGQCQVQRQCQLVACAHLQMALPCWYSAPHAMNVDTEMRVRPSRTLLCVCRLCCRSRPPAEVWCGDSP